MREQVRLGLLRYLEANAGGRFGLSTWVLRQYLKSDGLAVGTDEVRAELAYLREKGLVDLVDKVVSPENEAWRITAAGRDFYAGLA